MQCRVVHGASTRQLVHRSPLVVGAVAVRSQPVEMQTLQSLVWRDQLILSRDIQIAGDRTEFFERVKRGEFVALRRGVYMNAAEFHQLRPVDQYKMRALAVVAYADEDVVLSHASAAALWMLPWTGPIGRRVHMLVGNASGGRSSKFIERHTVGVPLRTERIDGVAVTTLARTVVDVACTTAFAQAVVVADAALRRTEHPVDGVPITSIAHWELLEELQRIPVQHGTARARRALKFASGLADRPGESVSRVNMALAGLRAPDLQVPMKGASGRQYYVDFWWPDFNVIGEFDGEAKYTDPEFLRGRTPEEALHDEKFREDDLRASRHGMSRWSWETANSVPKLRAHLLAAGVQ
jgi:hypothetical protein